jgi:hypothetical protein
VVAFLTSLPPNAYYISEGTTSTNTTYDNDMGDREPEDMKFFIVIKKNHSNTNTTYNNDNEPI